MKETRCLLSKSTTLVLVVLFCICLVFQSVQGASSSTNRWENLLRTSSGEAVVSVVTVRQDPNILYAVTKRSVFCSLDGGVTWHVLPRAIEDTTPYTVTAFAIDPTTPSTLYVGFGGRFWRSSDSGASWSPSPMGGMYITIDPQNPSTIYGVSGDTLYRSTDSGTTWTQQSTGLGLPTTDEWGRPLSSRASIRSLAIDPVHSATMYAGTYNSGVFRSDNSGVTWSAVSGDLPKLTISSIVIDPRHPANLFMVLGYGLYRTQNGGTTWAKCSFGTLTTSAVSVAIDPSDPSCVYAGTGVGVFRSADGGASWSPMATTGLQRSTIAVSSLAFDSSDPSVLYVGTGDGVYRWMPAAVVTAKLTLVIGSKWMTVEDTQDLVSNLSLDAAPMIGAGGRTLVPIRAVVEAIGGTAAWNAVSRTVTVKLGTVTLELTVGKKTARVNGSTVSIDTNPNIVPEIVNGRTMLPLRFVAESLGATVSWDSSTQTITIVYQGA